MSRVRVLHTVGNLDLGGGQKLVVLVASSLDKEQFEVAVLSFGPPGAYSDRLRTGGVEVIELGLVRPLRRNRPGTLIRALMTLVRVVVRGKWDVVHTHMFLSSVIVTPLARLGGARAMGTTHRIYYGRIQPTIERLVSVLQERIVVDSKAVGEILRARTHIPEGKYVVIHNGIDVDEFCDPPAQDAARATLGLPPDGIVVGEVAHLMPHKGQCHLIDAVAPLLRERSDVRLLLVGDGPDRVALERQVQAQGVSPRVLFAGARPDMRSVLSAIDVLALPSTFEGFGIVQAEAMYLERPVVATNHGGSMEVVLDGDTGFLVPFGDVEGLRVRLAELIDDPQLRHRMGTSGRARVLDRFTAERMAGSYAALYES